MITQTIWHLIRNSILAVALGANTFFVWLPTTVAESSECADSWILRKARGISCLHCTHPNAHRQADQLVNILKASCLKRVAISYLIDGTFGHAPDLLRSHIESLSSGERQLFITLYLTNGPAQRQSKNVEFPGFGAGLSPVEFRKRIESDPLFVAEYRQHVEKLLPLIQFASAHAFRVNIVPMLEDNLTDSAFAALLQHTQATIPKSVKVRYGRNPCPKCSPGNGIRVERGIFIEQHSAILVKVRNGLVSNDGSDHGGNVSQLIGVMERAAKGNNEFYIWTARFQGIPVSGELLDPDKRMFPEITPVENQALIKLLRH